MKIFRITFPGEIVTNGEFDTSHAITMLIHNLVTQLMDASIALHLFETSMEDTRARPKVTKEQGLAQGDRLRTAEEELLPAFLLEHGLVATDQMPSDLWQEIRYQAKLKISHEDEANGIMPSVLRPCVPMQHARSFVYALDGFQKTLLKLQKKVKGLDIDIEPSLQAIKTAFPDLTAVRDTAHHKEERIIGEAHERDIFADRDPNNPTVRRTPPGFLSTNGGRVISTEGLYGTKYGCTLANGSYGEIDVTAESLRQVQLILQGVIEIFSWSGPKRLEPSTTLVFR